MIVGQQVDEMADPKHLAKLNEGVQTRKRLFEEVSSGGLLDLDRRSIPDHPQSGVPKRKHTQQHAIIT
ncbi:MAG: hypothetical protein WB762_14215 [Candidatus Sulfotelmatobacter sp.]